MLEFFARLFETADFPARWHCGQWTAGHGWTYLLADLAIFGAYFAIPVILVHFLRQRKDVPFPRVLGLFAVFIICCGLTHFLDAAMFWWPAYRLSAVLRVLTAVVSWATVVALIPTVPKALSMRSLTDLERLAEERATTARTQTKRADWLDQMLAATGDAVVRLDDQGVVTFWNQGAATMYGYDAAQAVGRPFASLVVPEQESASHQRHLAAALRGVDDPWEATHRGPSGRSVDVSIRPSLERGEDGEVNGLAFIGRDISQRKQSERLIRVAVEASPSGLLMVGPDGTVRLSNQAVRALLGYHRPLQGMHVEGLVPGGLPDRGTESRTARRADGTTVAVDIASRPIELADGPHVLATLTDVTERLQAQALLERARDELEARVIERTQALERSNEDLQQFAYAASHDLSEPLRMVSSFTTLLLEEKAAQLDAEAREYLRFAHDGSMRMQALLHDLLAYSRVNTTPIEPEAVALATCLGEVLENLQVAIAEARATVQVPEELPSVCASRHQVVQLLQNLVGNGIKFAHPERDPEVRITAERHDDRVVLTVSDNGIGFEPDFAERIFTVFKRLHPSHRYPGTGIGLAICRRIAQRNGGSIRAVGRPDQGATFHIDLPAAP